MGGCRVLVERLCSNHVSQLGCFIFGDSKYVSVRSRQREDIHSHKGEVLANMPSDRG
jgi:23S rRNA-/tRNA-specific pseudouridylate synthase